MFDYSVWSDASEDLVREAAIQRLAIAQTRARTVWPFLANAQSEADFEARLDYAADTLRTYADFDSDLYSSLVASLREDFQILAKEKITIEEVDDDDDKDDKKSKKSKDDDDSDDDKDDDGVDDDEDKDGGKTFDPDNDGDDDSSAEGDTDNDFFPDKDDRKGKDKKGNPFGKKSSLPYSIVSEAAWIVIREDGKKRVAGPFPSKPQALDVAKAKGEGYTVEMAGE